MVPPRLDHEVQSPSVSFCTRRRNAPFLSTLKICNCPSAFGPTASCPSWGAWSPNAANRLKMKMVAAGHNRFIRHQLTIFKSEKFNAPCYLLHSQAGNKSAPARGFLRPAKRPSLRDLRRAGAVKAGGPTGGRPGIELIET